MEEYNILTRVYSHFIGTTCVLQSRTIFVSPRCNCDRTRTRVRFNLIEKRRRGDWRREDAHVRDTCKHVCASRRLISAPTYTATAHRKRRVPAWTSGDSFYRQVVIPFPFRSVRARARVSLLYRVSCNRYGLAFIQETSIAQGDSFSNAVTAVWYIDKNNQVDCLVAISAINF